MINELNTLVQFFSAIYFTIAIDSLMFKRFWTPDLYRIVKTNLERFKFALSTPSNEILLQRIKGYANQIDSQSRRRGVYFLMICVSLLALFSFEASFDEVNLPVLYLSLLISVTISGVLYLLGIFFLSRWRYVFISFLSVVLLNVLMVKLLYLPIFHSIYQWAANNVELILTLLKLFIIILIVTPVLFRLYVNWLNSTVYINYLVSGLQREYDAFVKTKDAIDKKDKSSADNSYDSIFKDAFFSDSPEKDQVYTALVKRLVDRLIDVCKPVSNIQLLKHRFSKSYKETIPNERDVVKTYALPSADDVRDMQLDNTIFNSLCLEYSKHHNVSLEKFCKDKGIEKNYFQEYRKKWLKSNLAK